MADTAAVGAAIIARLLTDPTLTALMPDGVFRDIGPSSKSRFVVVSQTSHEDHYQFGGPAWEILLYTIQARVRDTTGADVNTAKARIHTLLQDAALTVTGYTLMRLQRTIDLRYADIDPDDNDARWQYGGGVYEIWVAPT